MSAFTPSGLGLEAEGRESRRLLLFVTVNGHLTLALKSFTVERGEARGSRREAHSLQGGTETWGGKGTVTREDG